MSIKIVQFVSESRLDQPTELQWGVLKAWEPYAVQSDWERERVATHWPLLCIRPDGMLGTPGLHWEKDHSKAVHFVLPIARVVA